MNHAKLSILKWIDKIFFRLVLEVMTPINALKQNKLAIDDNSLLEWSDWLRQMVVIIQVSSWKQFNINIKLLNGEHKNMFLYASKCVPVPVLVDDTDLCREMHFVWHSSLDYETQEMARFQAFHIYLIHTRIVTYICVL